MSKLIEIAAVNEEKQIVYGVVYAPGELDTYGEMMTADGIEAMAHRFLMDVNLSQSIDRQHDNVAREAYPVESFIARANDPDYPEGAWVLGTKVVDPDIWSDIKSGKLNGYSFEATVYKRPVVVEIEYDPTAFGETEPADGHSHAFWVKINSDGVIVGGRTSRHADGHYHTISMGTATDMALNHAHRYFI